MARKQITESINKNGVYFHSQNAPIIWKVGVYIRLSVADGNDVSLSVKNQDSIIQYYLENEFNESYRLYKTYIDDGVSGTTNTERDAFQEMIDDIENGKVNCVVSKMLSRVFRNYSDQGYFLEEYFPRMGIRFITLETPKIDTFNDPSVVHGYEIPLNGIVNDRIAESTSRAVRQSLRNMRREGKFQGGFPPYGYIRNPQDIYSFIIDEEAADVVRQIFNYFVFHDMGTEKIRRKLNDASIPNPTGYKASKGYKYHNPGVQGTESYGWNSRTIKTILQNRIYLGEMVQGRYTVISYKVHKQIAVPKEEWVVVKDRHEAIIDEAVFDKAQEKLRLNKHMRRYESAPALLSGFVYCTDCNRKMHKRKNGKLINYACSTYYKRNRNDCTSHFTRAKLIEDAVLKAIQIQISFLDMDEIVDSIPDSNENEYQKRQEKQLKVQKQELKKIENQVEALYLDYNKRLITDKEYSKFRNTFTEKKESIEKRIAEINTEMYGGNQREVKMNQWKEVFKKHKNITELNRQVLEEMVDRIYVDQEKNITIKFKYGDLFKEYL